MDSIQTHCTFKKKSQLQKNSELEGERKTIPTESVDQITALKADWEHSQ